MLRDTFSGKKHIVVVSLPEVMLLCWAMLYIRAWQNHSSRTQPFTATITPQSRLPNTTHTGEGRLFCPQTVMVSWKISQMFQIIVWSAVSNLLWNCVLRSVASWEGGQRVLSMSCTDTQLQMQSYQLLRCIWEMNALHLWFYYTWMQK